MCVIGAVTRATRKQLLVPALSSPHWQETVMGAGHGAVRTPRHRRDQLALSSNSSRRCHAVLGEGGDKFCP